MEDTGYRAIAIVGTGAVLPDAPNVPAFWDNVKSGRYCISEVPKDRWDAALYYDSDRKAPDKTYSTIGGWVREYPWDPIKWKLAIPPRVVDGMDGGQRWALACVREALLDYGYPQRPLDNDRTAVIIGNAMGGEKHSLTSLRIFFPEYARELSESAPFASLPETLRNQITCELHDRMNRILPEITEDTMPGELSNCIAGRVANAFNFRGPNFTTDAACASAMPAFNAAIEGLIERHFDLAITGGIDRNMSAPIFVKFCKIGALSATGSRPFAEGADGFVMGEGAAIFILKRLADAERDGDKIYAIIRGVGGASDGKGKGITAPNPAGQMLAVERAWANAGVSPRNATYIEGHGTSTSAGDLAEIQSITGVLGNCQLPVGSVGLGSVKSNIGHLKGAAGAAGLLKTALALRDKVLPPSLNCERKNPNVDFTKSPVYVNTELRPWTETRDGARTAGVSAFGFGGTNWHVVMEEYVPHRLSNGNGRHSIGFSASPGQTSSTQAGGAAASRADQPSGPVNASLKAPLRGALVVGGASPADLGERLRAIKKAAEEGRAPAPAPPAEADLRAPERIAIDYGDAAELADKSAKALQALKADQPGAWKMLRAQGVFRGSGPAPKVAFLYTGQGSQYANMFRSLSAAEPVIADTFAEADNIMMPILNKRLTDYIFVDAKDPAAMAKAEDDLRQTEITQPAVLAADTAVTRLLDLYGIRPDFTMGHSLGEYGALLASGCLRFDEALHTVSARGRGMSLGTFEDIGKMAAVFAPLREIEKTLQAIDGYVVIANVNSNNQSVIGGASKAVEQAADALMKAGYNVAMLPVSHAFHTSIVAHAGEPLRAVLKGMSLQPPRIPIVTNVTGEFYPMGPGVVPQMIDLLGRQIASPVQFVKGLETLYQAEARLFVEVGPKKALQGFAEDVLGSRGDVVSLFTNHPKFADVTAFNQALCGMYAAGLGAGQPAQTEIAASAVRDPNAPEPPAPLAGAAITQNQFAQLGQYFANVLERGLQMYQTRQGRPADVPIVVSGAALGLPGTDRLFDDGNVGRILGGEQFIDSIPSRHRRAMADKHITRLVKTGNGGPVFETIDNPTDVVKLAGRAGAFDLESEYGVPGDRNAALDRVTRMAIAVGIDALRDAGIPLVMRYKTTTKNTLLPDRLALPDSMRDDTGVIFASCWPGFDSFAQENAKYYADRSRREQLTVLENLRARAADMSDGAVLRQELDRRIGELRVACEKEAYVLDRRFIFRTLAMGHSQFAEYIGARGPNTAINGACASTTHGVVLAQDWIRAGRCRRVIVVGADDITSDNLIEWFGSAFLASGVAATDAAVEEAALPFDRRRHGMIIGMGAAGLVVEAAESAQERGLRPICEILSAVMANSAFHGTRLDINHITRMMEQLVSQAEGRGFSRHEAASKMVFVSHETYTPARGGSAAAEINALRTVFGELADKIVIANTKGFTGHAIGAGIEDVVAVKALETGCVPPVANFKEIDPELGQLNLSKGGAYPIEYALRLGAGFGSQIGMTLLRRIPGQSAARPSANALGYAYRIENKQAWDAWIAQAAGRPGAELEVVNRTLRICAQAGVPSREAASQTVQAPPPPPPAPKPAIEAAVKAAPPVVNLAPKPPAPKPEPAALAADPVKQRIMALVAEKTGYPVEMLDLDLDLEADLGVDTVKQAEVFAGVREAYGITRDEKLKLRDFPTLAHVIRFVYDRRPDLAQPAPAMAASAPISAPAAPPPQAFVAAAAADPIRERVIDLVVEKTGYPREMLELDLDLEADLGVDTVKQAELFASIREIYDIPRDANLKLRDFPTLKHVIGFVKDRRPDLVAAAPPPAAPVEKPAEAAPLAAKAMAMAIAIPELDEVQEKVLGIMVEKTGYPREMLDLDLDLEADLGVDTVKQAEMFASVRETFGIAREAEMKLRDFPTLKHVIQFVKDRRPDLATAPKAQPVIVDQTAAPTPPEAEAATVASASSDPIQEKVLEIVVEKTGYPREMLDLDLDLEADLGVDTVKQAEMFASVRATFGIPRDTELKLRDFPTLKHVIQFARERSTAAVAAAAPVAPERPVPAGFEATNVIPRRVPVPVLRPPLDMTKRTAVSLESGKRVIVVPDQGGVGEALAERLRAMGVEVVDLAQAGKQPVDGIYWLPALDNEGDLREMDLAAWREALRIRVKSLYSTMRDLYEQIASAGTFLVSATRLGGQHGYDDAGAVAPLGGAVAGFTKTYKRERMDAFVKTVDFEAAADPAAIAESLIQETLLDPGAVEIGYKGGVRWTIGLEQRAAADGQPGMKLDANTVFLITGAAGSIVSAITADLASASGGIFYLLDLTPEPDPNNADLERFETDKDGLKKDLAARIKATGRRATPAMIEKQLAALERERAAQNAINAVRAAGGTAHYFSVNLTDAEAVANVIGQVRERSGRIDVLLHAAGMERSHFLPAKDPKEFDLVFDVKADGWFNLLRAIGDMPLGAAVAFSSIAGRFGNAGQADYSSANDLLCKILSSWRTTRPSTRGIAIDWTAWGGIGMASRGSIPKMMEMAGIDMLPPEAGVPWIRRELTDGASRNEVVVAGALGILLQEWDAGGGVSAEIAPQRGPMLGSVESMTLQRGLAVQTTLDPAAQPFLYDHRIDGTAVLPGVMSLEAVAEASQSVAPGWHIADIEDVEFAAPFKFYRDEPRTVAVEAMIRQQGESLVADCRVTGSRTLAGQAEPQITTYTTARVRLAKGPAAAQAEPASPPASPNGFQVKAADIYRLYFHGPAYQVLESTWRDGDRIVGLMAQALPPNHQPSEMPALMAPRLIELCFQTAGIWEMSERNRMGLPHRIDRVALLRSPEQAAGRLFAIVTPRPEQESYDAEVVDEAGNRYVAMSGYRTVALPNAVDAAPLKARASTA